MVIEWLKVRVSPELRELFVQKDNEIWTATLAKYPGFLGKEVWIDPSAPNEVVLVIRWANREAWKSVPASELEATEARFTQQMGKVSPIVQAGEYQVRKFPQPKT